MRIEHRSGDDVEKRGTQASDEIYAFDGADEIYGRGGNDRTLPPEQGFRGSRIWMQIFLDGGNDNDIFYNLGLEDRISGGSGYDIAVLAMENATTRAVVRNSDFGFTNWRGINQFEGVLTQFNDILKAGFGLRSIDCGAVVDTYTTNHSFLFGGRSENRS